MNTTIIFCNKNEICVLVKWFVGDLTTETLEGLISKQYTILFTGVKKYTRVIASMTKMDLSKSLFISLGSLGTNDMTLHCSVDSQSNSSSTICMVPKRFRYHMTRMSALIDLPSSISTYTHEATAYEPMGMVRGTGNVNTFDRSFCCYNFENKRLELRDQNRRWSVPTIKVLYLPGTGYRWPRRLNWCPSPWTTSSHRCRRSCPSFPSSPSCRRPVSIQQRSDNVWTIKRCGAGRCRRDLGTSFVRLVFLSFATVAVRILRKSRSRHNGEMIRTIMIIIVCISRARRRAYNQRAEKLIIYVQIIIIRNIISSRNPSGRPKQQTEKPRRW